MLQNVCMGPADMVFVVFPDVIDKLQPEVGNYLGPKPKLFSKYTFKEDGPAPVVSVVSE
jgi:hypothetical protein